MEKLKGRVQRGGSVAYVSQQAWIYNDSLQENTVFGSNLNRPYYKLVLESCALLPDLEQLLNGNRTEIGERVGIVGRTGAGKSTLTNCLFRVLEGCEGKIIIDGIDISTIGLHDLHGNLNIIPQSNLDPLGKHSDLELWEVLGLCDLRDFVQSLPKKLLHEISEGGENLRVLVLDAGRIIEYDTPQNLLQQKGAFSEMVAEAGIKR